MEEPKTTAPENSDPSERMPGKLGKRRATEKQRHIDAFQLYLKLGTIELVARAINRKDKVVQAWSARHQWVHRAKADALRKAQNRADEVDRLDRQEVAFWTKQGLEHRKRKLKSGGALMDRGDRKLTYPDLERPMNTANGPSVFRPRSDKEAAVLIISGSKLIDEAIAEALAVNTKFQEIEEFELDPLGEKDDDPQT